MRQNVASPRLLCPVGGGWPRLAPGVGNDVASPRLPVRNDMERRRIGIRLSIGSVALCTQLCRSHTRINQMSRSMPTAIHPERYIKNRPSAFANSCVEYTINNISTIGLPNGLKRLMVVKVFSCIKMNDSSIAKHMINTKLIVDLERTVKANTITKHIIDIHCAYCRNLFIAANITNCFIL